MSDFNTSVNVAVPCTASMLTDLQWKTLLVCAVDLEIQGGNLNKDVPAEKPPVGADNRPCSPLSCC